MTKVAAASQLASSNALHFGSGSGGGGGSKISTTTLKRKTPSELRGELLKRKNSVDLVDEFPAPVLRSMRNTDGVLSGSKKSDSSKAPRYIDTRMDELFPVTKNSIRLRLLSRKENPKETLYNESVDGLKISGVPMDLNAKHQLQNSRLGDTVDSGGVKDYSNQASNTTEKCNITFQSVRELSLGGEKLNGSSLVDMDKALKGLVSCEPHTTSAQLAETDDSTGHVIPKSFCSEFHVSGHNIPLDLTLKTTMRLLSTSSVNWFHRLINCDASFNGTSQFTSVGCPSQSMACSSEPTSTSQKTNPWTFHSWVHPQSTLPHSAIAALTIAAGGQMDFLSKRQQAWEDSFRSLYYMLRKKMCKIFYVCTMQFVVMFTGSNDSKETKCSCFAYISQSTTNLRSLLKEHGASFSMPLCYSKVEEVTAEDLVELSEIEKYNLGQTRAMETMAGVDNSPQSLLMFTGNKNIHALYDFLLNYRFFLTSLTGGDGPVLYSPVPFENAALSAPEIRCKQVRRADYISSQRKESNMDSAPYRNSSAGICYSVEIRDVYLPPWVICGICNAMSSNGGDFQASFVTESTSIGLNVGLDLARDQPAQQSTTDEPLQENGHSFGILNATLSPHLGSAFLKGLKYSDGSYTASLSAVA